jgi:hypothetical protein
LHDRFYAIERDARLVRSYQPGAVLGVLQTAEYIESVFTAGGHGDADEVAELVANRLRRNTMMVTDPDREWRLIQTVGALDWNVAGAVVMAAQIERIIEATSLPNVRLGVVPAKRPVRFFAQHGFHIYDDSAVLVGTVSATALTENRVDLDEYTRLFSRLEDAAVYDGLPTNTAACPPCRRRAGEPALRARRRAARTGDRGHPCRRRRPHGGYAWRRRARPSWR